MMDLDRASKNSHQASRGTEQQAPFSHENITRLVHDGKEIYLVGTAHISERSRLLVRRAIQELKPDTVCVELDQRRFKAIAQKERWENLDIKKVIKKKELPTLMANLILAAYQKKLGEKLGVAPGAELVEAVKCAEEADIPVELCDRDVRVTLLRAWRKTPLWKKGKLLATLINSLFEDVELDEEKLEELKKSDVISELMAELGQAMPEMKQVLIDERDCYLAEKIRSAPGRRIVAVVGAGHVQGIVDRIRNGKDCDLSAISEIPPLSPAWKAAGWAIPAVIVGSIMVIGWQKGLGAAGDNVLYWVLANGIACALGAVAALSHPATIASAFAAAPITSLTPVIGAGYVTAFVQAMVAPPLVKEIQNAGQDVNSLKGWWSNRLLKVFLAFLLPGIGSMVGTWLGGYRIISNLFG